MKRFILSLSLSFSALMVFAGSIYLMERSGKAVFSTTNSQGTTVTATNTNYNSILRPKQANFTISMPIKGFTFENYMMVDQFAGKDYLNAGKEAMIRYDGTLVGMESLQLKKLTETTVEVTGTLRINGIEQELASEITLKKTDEGVTGTMSLKNIQLAPFGIVPSEAIKTQLGEVINFDCELLWKELDHQGKK